MELIVPRVDDFELTGDGAAAAWRAAEWQPLVRVGDGKATYPTRAKVLYSQEGVYFLVDCQDSKLSCTLTEDFADLFTEDVVEVFLWPHEPQWTYLEYEISPLGTELPILVTNHDRRFHGWLPWHYSGPRRARRATAVRGGPKAPGAAVEGWSVECFIPFALLVGLANTPPQPGTRWRANVYRIDFDARPASQWAWCPDTGGDFHNFRRFGTFLFG